MISFSSFCLCFYFLAAFIPASLSDKARQAGSVSSCEAERQKFVQRSVSRKFWPSVDTISLTGVQEKSRAVHGFIFGNVLQGNFSATALILHEKIHVAPVFSPDEERWKSFPPYLHRTSRFSLRYSFFMLSETFFFTSSMSMPLFPDT